MLIDGQVDCEDPVVIGHGEVVGAVGRPGEVDRGVAHWLVRVVDQSCLDGGVLPTVESRDVVQLEVSCANYGDIDVCSGRCQHRCLIACEVVVRISEVSADAEDPG